MTTEDGIIQCSEVFRKPSEDTCSDKVNEQILQESDGYRDAEMFPSDPESSSSDEEEFDTSTACLTATDADDSDAEFNRFPVTYIH